MARNGLTLWFLDPADAAISKYARGEPRDLRWISAGLRAGLIALHDVQERIKTTPFLDGEEERRVRELVRAHVDAFKANRH